MTDTTENQEISQEEILQALKNKADMLGVTYHPSIGMDKLREKVDAKMAEQPTEDPVDTGHIPNSGVKPTTERKLSEREQAMLKASKLVRCIINSRDANKKDWPGELMSAGNSVAGFFKKYIPYGVEWHVPQIILNTLRDKKTQVFVSRVDSRGNKTKVGKLINAYTIDELDPLTPKELSDLARAQQASGRLEDNE